MLFRKKVLSPEGKTIFLVVVCASSFFRQILDVAQAGFELTAVLLLQLPKHWDYRPMLPHLAHFSNK